MTALWYVTLFFGGVAALLRGVWLINHPTAWIVGGLIAIAFALILAKDSGGHRSKH